jgi:hypothetical protein
MLCPAGVLLVGLAVAAIRASEYGPGFAKLTAAELHKRARRVNTIFTPATAIGYLCLSVGAFMVTRDLVVLAVLGCFGLTQVAVVDRGRRARRRAVKAQQSKAGQ